MLVRLVPLLLLLLILAFDVFCLRDLARADAVRHLSKVAWAFVICFSSPFGGLAYLGLGRVR